MLVRAGFEPSAYHSADWPLSYWANRNDCNQCFKVVFFKHVWCVVSHLLIFLLLYTSAVHKEVISNKPGLVDFAIGLVNSVLNLPKWLENNYLNNTSTFRQTVIKIPHKFMWTESRFSSSSDKVKCVKINIKTRQYNTTFQEVWSPQSSGKHTKFKIHFK